MDSKEMVSYIVYESSQTRSDRIINRLIIALLISVLITFVTNALWLYTFLQDSGTEINNTEGMTNVIEGDGEITDNQS